MKKTIKVVDEKRGIVQCTSVDERWYAVPSKDPATGLPIYEYFPSSSWVASYDYMPKALLDWAKKNGVESDQIMIDAASRGSHIHHAIEMIIRGEKLVMDTLVFNGQNDKEEPLTTDEWEVVKTFVDWNNEVKPKYLLSECTVISKKYGFGGTLDAVAVIGDKMYLIDFKTSKSIYSSHLVQIASYKQALIEDDEKYKGIELAILQVGYRMNKKGYKFTPVEDKFARFLRDYETWREENPDSKPRQIDLPMVLGVENSMKAIEKPPLVGADAIEKLWEKRGGRGDLPKIEDIEIPQKKVAKPIKK